MLSDTLDKVALECGAVRDPNGYYLFTPEELKTFVEKINERPRTEGQTEQTPAQ
jgi:hypothetical protein